MTGKIALDAPGYYVACPFGLPVGNPLSLKGKVRPLLFYNFVTPGWKESPDVPKMTIGQARMVAKHLRSHREHPAGIDPRDIYVADQFGNDIEIKET